ncbi:hypothetical protein GCM10020367_50980 [Streptomyces sannanensis]|uniref:Uncharacterized protein n=1 Tax=Streptomyces sannanensis TaxID=285536 RepID=A0ABP6SHG8_9ACTN
MQVRDPECGQIRHRLLGGREGEVRLELDPVGGGGCHTNVRTRPDGFCFIGFRGTGRPGRGAASAVTGKVHWLATPGTALRCVVESREYGQVRAAILRLAMHRTGRRELPGKPFRPQH